MSKTRYYIYIRPLADILPVMTAKKLKEYFDNKISAEELKADVENSQTKTGYDTTSIYIKQIEDNEDFEVKKVHLIKNPANHKCPRKLFR